MQYKKKDIYDRIIEAGKTEYALKGFRQGNISAVAENAGVPVGNLYRYFDGKTGLLDAIVKPAYDSVPALLSEMQKIQVLDSFTLEEIMPFLVTELLSFFENYGKEVLILVDHCTGTRYEDFTHDIVSRVTEIIYNKLYKEEGEKECIMAGIIAKSFLSSLFDLLRMNLNRESMQELMSKLVKFYFYEVNQRK